MRSIKRSSRSLRVGLILACSSCSVIASSLSGSGVGCLLFPASAAVGPAPARIQSLICDSARRDSRVPGGTDDRFLSSVSLPFLPWHSRLCQPAWTGFRLSTLAPVTDYSIRRRRWPCQSVTPGPWPRVPGLGERSEPHTTPTPTPQSPSHRLFNPAPPVALLAPGLSRYSPARQEPAHPALRRAVRAAVEQRIP